DRLTPSGQVIASAAFNDASGVNSNPTANSPYTLGASIETGDNSEPGWASQWVVSDGGGPDTPSLATVTTSAPFEGDGAAHIIPGTLDGETWVHRQFSQAQFAQFEIEEYIKLPANGAVNADAYGNDYGAYWRVANNKFYAGAGDGAG